MLSSDCVSPVPPPKPMNEALARETAYQEGEGAPWPAWLVLCENPFFCKGQEEELVRLTASDKP